METKSLNYKPLLCRSVKCNFKVGNRLAPQLDVLDILTQQPQLQQTLAALLLQEVEQMESGTWRESTSIFESLLSVSSVVNPETFRFEIESPAREVFTATPGYPTNRGMVDSCKKFLRTNINDAHRCVACTVKAEGGCVEPANLFFSWPCTAVGSMAIHLLS